MLRKLAIQPGGPRLGADVPVKPQEHIFSFVRNPPSRTDEQLDMIASCFDRNSSLNWDQLGNGGTNGSRTNAHTE